MYKLGIALFVFAALSCGRPQGPETSQDHSKESLVENTRQSTLYSDHTEFYIEYEPLIVGKESGFLVHVTDLASYDPVSGGSVSIELGGKKAESGPADSPGIFHIFCIPEKPGILKLSYNLVSGSLTDRVTEEVRVEESDHEMHEEEEGEVANMHIEANEAKGEIIFLKEQAWKSDFMVEEVKRSPFSSVISASGEILAMPGEKKHIPAKSSGILLFQEKNLVQGTRVEKGQPLFIISAATLDEDNFELRYRELANSLEKSRSEYQRHKVLYANEVISERVFIESKTAYTGDSIRFYNLASRVTEKGLKVEAPISGYIHELNFSEGQYVEAGQQIVSISNNRNLLLRADVPMQHYALVEKIETANFRTAYAERIYSLASLNGKLLAKGSSVAENDNYIPVYFGVENDGTLLEGAFVEFYLKTSENESSVVVPVSAVLEEQGNHYLYVQVSGESYTRREIKTGENDGSKVEILSGVKTGERIVTEGVMLLKAASMVTGGASHGHNH